MDRRIRHTKERLGKAMVSCLKDHALDEITVKMLCDMADVNRSTFYAHYLSPHDLYKEIEENMTKYIVKGIDQINANEPTYPELIRGSIDYYDANSETLMVLLRTNSVSFKNECIKYLAKTKPVKAKSKELTIYYQEFLVAGIFAVVGRWIQEGKKESKTEIANVLLELLGNQ